MNTGSGRSFNLYRTANQLCITGRELTGNQWMQPPILHQYCPTPTPPPPSFPRELLRKKQCCFVYILRMSLSACFLFITDSWGGGGMITLRNRVSPPQIGTRRLQLEECTGDCAYAGRIGIIWVARWRKRRGACAAGALTQNQAAWLCVALPWGRTMGDHE